MTRQEVQQLLMIIAATFPNFRAENKTETVNAWLVFLEEYEARDVMLALSAYVKNNTTGFAPSVSQLINQMEKPKELSVMDEPAAWALVSNAIRRSTYNSQAEFDKLPPTIQKTVGSPSQLFQWATDESYNNEVVMSVFQKNYRTICQRQRDYERLPQQMQAIVDKTCEKLGQIKVNEPLRIATQIEQPPVVDIVKTENGETFVDTARYMSKIAEQLSKQE